MALLSTCVDTTMEEELAIMSVKERDFSIQKFSREPEVASIVRGSSFGNMLKGSGRGSTFMYKGFSRGSGFSNRSK